MSPSPWVPLVYLIVGGISASINLTSPSLPLQIGTGIIASGSLFMFLLSSLTYIGDWFTTWFTQWRLALSKSKQSELANAMRGQPEYVARIIQAQGELSEGVLATPDGPRRYVMGTTVPLCFLDQEFLPHCSIDRDGTTFLAPISSWHDGWQFEDYGEGRVLANEFTNHLIAKGWALPAVGNQPARLTGKRNAFDLRRAYGLVDEE